MVMWAGRAARRPARRPADSTGNARAHRLAAAAVHPRGHQAPSPHPLGELSSCKSARAWGCLAGGSGDPRGASSLAASTTGQRTLRSSPRLPARRPPCPAADLPSHHTHITHTGEGGGQASWRARRADGRCAQAVPSAGAQPANNGARVCTCWRPPPGDWAPGAADPAATTQPAQLSQRRAGRGLLRRGGLRPQALPFRRTPPVRHAPSQTPAASTHTRTPTLRGAAKKRICDAAAAHPPLWGPQNHITQCWQGDSCSWRRLGGSARRRRGHRCSVLREDSLPRRLCRWRRRWPQQPAQSPRPTKAVRCVACHFTQTLGGGGR